eukprot:SAG31_NODE_14760_length_789_cov_0.701449_1_plen_141_part_10
MTRSAPYDIGHCDHAFRASSPGSTLEGRTPMALEPEAELAGCSSAASTTGQGVGLSFHCGGETKTTHGGGGSEHLAHNDAGHELTYTVSGAVYDRLCEQCCHCSLSTTGPHNALPESLHCRLSHPGLAASERQHLLDSWRD